MTDLESKLIDIENILVEAGYAVAHMDTEFPKKEEDGVTFVSPTHEAVGKILSAVLMLHEVVQERLVACSTNTN